MARFLISDGSVSKLVSKYKIAFNGLVWPITKAVAADGGIARQYWPSADVPDTDPSIVWDTTPITVSQSVQDPADSIAFISFTASLGTYTYANYPDANGYEVYLNPPVTGAGEYLVRCDQTGGDALTGTLGSWVDVFTDPTFSLNQTAVGTGNATANISISKDDGAGAPVAATTIVKPVTYVSEVRGAADDIAWTTLQRDLVEIKDNVDADCTITFNPSGSATGSADTSGSFDEIWNAAYPTTANPENYTVQVDLISGQAPAGDVLGAPLALDQVRSWLLVATTGEDLTNELDVTVDDLVPAGNQVVKRITMHSQRNETESDNVWTADSWVLDDVWDTGLGPAGVQIVVGIDGVVEATSYNGGIGDSEDWNSLAPTPPDTGDYEARLDLLTGSTDIIGDTGVWFNLASEVSWSIESSSGEINVTTYNLSIRRVGQAAVAKPVRVILSIET